MIEDKKFVEQSSNFEKVLGYHYNTNLDYLKISNDSVDRTVKTKRGVLSQLCFWSFFFYYAYNYQRKVSNKTVMN